MTKGEKEKVFDINSVVYEMINHLDKSYTVINLVDEEYFSENEPNNQKILFEYDTMKNLCEIVKDYLYEISKLAKSIQDNSEQLLGD